MGSVSRDLYTPSPVNSTADSALPPTLYLIRHGEAQHNVSDDHTYTRDTILTPTGELQAAGLRSALPASSRLRIGAVVASPLRRALQTALIGFEDLIIPDNAKVVTNQASVDTTVLDAAQTQGKPLRVVALPEAREMSTLPFNRGLPVADLVAEFDAVNSKWRGCVNFDLVSPEWSNETWPCGIEVWEQRAREARRWLREKMRQLSLSDSHATTSSGEGLPPRSDIVLVTHAGIVRYLADARTSTPVSTLLIGLPADTVSLDDVSWENAEVRSYHFVAGVESEADANATIVETEQSRRTRLEKRRREKRWSWD
jgi:broad specificity phosphatase PhoE